MNEEGLVVGEPELPLEDEPFYDETALGCRSSDTWSFGGQRSGIFTGPIYSF